MGLTVPAVRAHGGFQFPQDVNAREFITAESNWWRPSDKWWSILKTSPQTRSSLKGPAYLPEAPEPSTEPLFGKGSAVFEKGSMFFFLFFQPIRVVFARLFCMLWIRSFQMILKLPRITCEWRSSRLVLMRAIAASLWRFGSTERLQVAVTCFPNWNNKLHPGKGEAVPLSYYYRTGPNRSFLWYETRTLIEAPSRPTFPFPPSAVNNNGHAVLLQPADADQRLRMCVRKSLGERSPCVWAKQSSRSTKVQRLCVGAPL